MYGNDAFFNFIGCPRTFSNLSKASCFVHLQLNLGKVKKAHNLRLKGSQTHSTVVSKTSIPDRVKKTDATVGNTNFFNLDEYTH